IAKLAENVLDFLDLVLRALARIDVGNVDDGLLGGIEDIEDVINIGAAVEEVADVELLEVFVAVELFVVGVGDGIELGFVLRSKDGLRVAPEVGASHSDDVRLVPSNELPQMLTKLVVWVSRNMMELIDGDQAVVERFYAVSIDREAEGRVSADQ